MPTQRKVVVSSGSDGDLQSSVPNLEALVSCDLRLERVGVSCWDTSSQRFLPSRENPCCSGNGAGLVIGGTFVRPSLRPGEDREPLERGYLGRDSDLDAIVDHASEEREQSPDLGCRLVALLHRLQCQQDDVDMSTAGIFGW
jgi:hypothetical protein